MKKGNKLSFSGKLGTKVTRAPKAGAGWRLRNALRVPYIWGLVSSLLSRGVSRLTGNLSMTSQLKLRHTKADGRVINHGVVGRRVITTAFVNFVVDQLIAESSVFGDFKYHDSGVGTTAEAVGDTGIETTDGESRATGNQAEGAANEYESVGTIAYTTTKAITEHGLFNDPTAGTLMDRTVFTAINVENGDSIQFTYTLTVTAGG